MAGPGETPVIVYKDEPSSVIALTLSSRDYQFKLAHLSNPPPADITPPEKWQLPPDKAFLKDSLLSLQKTHIKSSSYILFSFSCFE
jgi:hypothetical protein